MELNSSHFFFWPTSLFCQFAAMKGNARAKTASIAMKVVMSREMKNCNSDKSRLCCVIKQLVAKTARQNGRAEDCFN